jgi:hypothetical protein
MHLGSTSHNISGSSNLSRSVPEPQMQCEGLFLEHRADHLDLALAGLPSACTKDCNKPQAL